MTISLLLGIMLMTTGFVVSGGVGNVQVKVESHETLINVPQKAIDSSSRVIVATTSKIDKFIFKIKGCKIINELYDSTALRCPERVVAGLENVREDRIFQIIDLEADEQINADDVWTMGINGSGVNVAVLDTGIDTDHSELQNSYLGGYDYVYDDAYPEDDHGHGTHVSGIITANGEDGDAKGVAPGAGIYMYKVCDASGSCYESDMMMAMEAVVAKKTEDPTLKVMSISIGGGNFAGENCDSDPLAAKVNWVVSNGINVVVASGNDKYYISSPACASGAIAVGATDKNGLMASFSNFGSALDIVAPGVSIYSSLPNNNYDWWTGTSMSTPHVSGVIALMLEANSGLTTDNVKTALYETANPVNSNSVCYGVTGTRGRTIQIGIVECTPDNYGAGIVNAFGAVNYFTPAEPECEHDEYCNDGLYCNGIETCVSGFCQSGTSIDCSNLGDQCNNGVCDEELDGCISQAKPEWTSCNDGLFCTENDYCSAGICSSGISKTCDDGESCTTDLCNENQGACENTWSECGIDDGCCGPDCDSTNDEDCVVPIICGDGYCSGVDSGEDCNTCSEDCPGYSRGRPSGRYCCGNGICESTESSLGNCPVDCIA